MAGSILLLLGSAPLRADWRPSIADRHLSSSFPAGAEATPTASSENAVGNNRNIETVSWNQASLLTVSLRIGPISSQLHPRPTPPLPSPPSFRPTNP